ncbi:EI24 domain-containing protein [Altererythrobacter aquiaggeris]|uniref:EI24 domain-containing protein n=1 Tax=Aestuarierythrobacter aquiaggeris TaxID=1898396 RepID=UPI003016539E
MGSVLSAFGLAFGQLADRRILAILAKTIAVTLLVFAALAYAGSFAFDALLERSGFAQASDEVSSLLALLAGLLAGWFLFRFVALAVIQFFAEDVVQAVEDRHYPEAAHTARKLSFSQEASGSLKSAARAIIVNLIALPFAIVLLVTGIGAPLLFWAVNAHLLGRELQDMVWLRQPGEADEKPPLTGPTRFMLGGVVAALLLIPFVNLLAPVLGAASAAHLIHRKRIVTHAR